MKNDPDIKDLVQSSVADIEKFEKNIVWNDILTILKDWDAGLKKDYDEANTMEDIRRLQGISECISYLRNLPEAMKTIVSLETEGERNDS